LGFSQSGRGIGQGVSGQRFPRNLEEVPPEPWAGSPSLCPQFPKQKMLSIKKSLALLVVFQN
jgi:hypothetical protein